MRTKTSNQPLVSPGTRLSASEGDVAPVGRDRGAGAVAVPLGAVGGHAHPLGAQLLPGRKVNGKCVAQTAGNRRNKACTRSVPTGSLSFNAGAGPHKLFFQGRLTRTRKLQPGTYTLTITATNAAGQRATKGPLRSFTIVPG